MNEIIKFLNIHYKNAIKLVKAFDITKQKSWNAEIYLNELYVQIGHVFNVLYKDKNTEEKARKIDNLGDELSDVILQLINLGEFLNINMYDISSISEYKVSDLNSFNILLGQLTEAIMENNDCRFRKNRVGFNSSYEFMKDRIFKLFIIIFNIASLNKLDMVKEFDLMLEDANKFLNNFEKRTKTVIEFIDIYDKNEKFLGFSEKQKAHQNGYWHKTVSAVIYNKKSKKVYFQLKNPKHNNVHKEELLELTASGHLTAGETLKDVVREVKEETGLEVDYEDMNFIYKNICDKTEDYVIREFQYYYSLNMSINLKDFKNYDKSEVNGFVEVNINDVIKLLENKYKMIKGKIIRDNNIKRINLNIDNFDPDFVKNKLFITLMLKVKNLIKNDKINNEYKKLYKLTDKEKKKSPQKYYFDNGKNLNVKDYKKKNIKYSVIEYNTKKGIKDYIVFILALKDKKSVTHIKIKRFKNKYLSDKYFSDLCLYVESNTNEDIIRNAIENLEA